MSTALDTTLAHLRQLVSFDTRNPPRRITADGVFAYLVGQLPGFDCELTDLGNGSVNLLARRGRPNILFNFHIDTVPAAPSWETDPFELQVGRQCATGLGACDIKGAAACMLTAVAHSPGPVALLFSSDEEAGEGRCIRRFLESDYRFDGVVVAEPTAGKAVLAHRGIASARLRFTGHSGHASDNRAGSESAIHRAVRWAYRALQQANASDERYHNLSGLRFNIGQVSGGIKPNMIAAEAEMRCGARALPGRDSAAVLTRLAQLAEPHEIGSFEISFCGPALPATDSQYPPAPALQLAQSLGLPVGEPVDFWTEAALFDAAGIPALVYGPGNIAQAHTAGEWVSLDELDKVTSEYMRILS